MSAILPQSSRGWASIRPSTKSSIASQRGVAANGRPSPAQSVKHDKPSGSRGRNPNSRGLRCNRAQLKHKLAKRQSYALNHTLPAAKRLDTSMARNASRLKLGYYPLVPDEAQRLCRFLEFPPECAVLDPCAGTGAALRQITGETRARRYGIELDSFRAMEAGRVLDEVVQGSVFDTHCAVESYSLLYLNPPYDDEIAEGRNQRMEGCFWSIAFAGCGQAGFWCWSSRAIASRAVQTFWHPTSAILESTGSRIRRRLGIPKLPSSESAEPGAKGSDCMTVTYPPLGSSSPTSGETTRAYLRCRTSRTALYSVPPSAPNVRLTYRGLPMDVLEDLLPSSRAYRQAGRILFAPEVQVHGRPLTPLHAGHVGILSCSGLLNGVFGTGEARHVACWETGKVVDRFEETDDQEVTTIRERERFTQRLTLVFADGRTAVLSEEDPDAKCTPEDGAA